MTDHRHAWNSVGGKFTCEGCGETRDGVPDEEPSTQNVTAQTTAISQDELNDLVRRTGNQLVKTSGVDISVVYVWGQFGLPGGRHGLHVSLPNISLFDKLVLALITAILELRAKALGGGTK